MFLDSYPHDFHKLEIDTLLQSNALEAPLMGTFKLRTIVCYEPYSNLYGWYDNNTRESTSALMQKKLHTYVVPTASSGEPYAPQQDSPDDAVYVTGIPRGGLFDYLGIPPGTIRTDDQGPLIINIERVLAYLDFIRMYSANRQETDLVYMTGVSEFTGTYTETVPLSTLDSLFMELRYLKDGFQFGSSASINSTSNPGMSWLNDYLETCTGGKNSGLFLCMYEPDYFMNFLQLTTGSVKSTVEVGADGTFSMHELYFKNKIQHIIDSFDMSGGVLSNWSRTLWNARPRGSMDVPDIVGSLTTVIDPSNITVVSDTYNKTTDTGSAPGELAGNINQYNGGRYDVKSNRFRFGMQEEGIFFVISQLIPCPDYSQGIDPSLLRLTYMDKYKMQLQRLGFQDVPQETYSSLPLTDNTGCLITPGSTGYDPKRVLYKQVAWLDLMTATSRLHGDFTNFGNKEYWALNRRFARYSVADKNGTATRRLSGWSFSRYIDPGDWQYPFTGTSINDHNFFVQYGFSLTSIRAMGKRFNPSFE